MKIYKNLRQRRLELNLTLEQVADMVGVARSTVHRWENGFISNMKVDKVEALAKALQVTPAFILECSEFELQDQIADIQPSPEYKMKPIETAILTTCSYLSYNDQCDVLKYATSLLYKDGE